MLRAVIIWLLHSDQSGLKVECSAQAVRKSSVEFSIDQGFKFLCSMKLVYRITGNLTHSKTSGSTSSPCLQCSAQTGTAATELTVPLRLCAGAMAGMTATALTHPLDVMRLRLALPNSPYTGVRSDTKIRARVVIALAAVNCWEPVVRRGQALHRTRMLSNHWPLQCSSAARATHPLDVLAHASCGA
jgi:hypothetical protein